MRPVRVLPSDLADQIAAGEVVERPASVVKELIENALDANAASIRVEIEQGGTTLIRTSDDGHGMEPGDARLAIRRHATSKIASKDDLHRIQTLGFRGEALPSIASVSRFSLATKTQNALAGIRIQVDGGGEASESELGRAPGTTITVADLFYNVPARKKFLKSVQTESAQIRDVLIRAALAFPHLRLTFARDGRTALELFPARSLEERATALFPEEKLITIEGEREGIRVCALLSAPERSRSGASGLYLYVNRRAVRDRALARTVAFAYGSVLPPGRYPAGVVHLEIDVERVDVNVHPQKAEVRFDNARQVLDAVTRILAHELGTTPWRRPNIAPSPAISEYSAGNDEWGLSGASPPSAATDPPTPFGISNVWPRGNASRPLPYRSATSVGQTSGIAESLAPSTGAFGSLRVLGQLRRTYLICEGSNGLIVLDQHAADERIRFYSLKRAFESKSVSMQRLLLPERVEITSDEAALIEERNAELAGLGLDVARIGESTAAVHAIPALIRRASPAHLLRDVLAQLALEGSRAYSDAVDTALATMACHGAIRAGDILAEAEMRALLTELDRIPDFAEHCPHGRPVVYELGLDEIAKQVGR